MGIGNGLRVLIVDDSAVMRKIVARALGQAGLDISEQMFANDGAEALALLRREADEGREIDLILSDMHMPVMNGLEFLQELARLKLAVGVPVVMVTADGSDPMVLEAIAAGAQSYISKPFTLGQMHDRVASLFVAA